MVYGHPPLELTLEQTEEYDRRDLRPHGVFPTYFLETTFLFDEDNTATVYNVEHAGGGALVEDPDGEMLFHEFAFDITGLQPGYNLHFDLYHTRLRNRANDIDIQFFAPFSKDAGTLYIPPVVTNVPAPPALLVLGVALLALARSRRRAR